MNKKIQVVYGILRGYGFDVLEIKDAIHRLERGDSVLLYREPCNCNGNIRHWDGGNYHEVVWLHPFSYGLILETTDTREFQADTESLELATLAPNGKIVILSQGMFDRKIDRSKLTMCMTCREREMEVIYGDLGASDDIPADWWTPPASVPVTHYLPEAGW